MTSRSGTTEADLTEKVRGALDDTAANAVLGTARAIAQALNLAADTLALPTIDPDAMTDDERAVMIVAYRSASRVALSIGESLGDTFRDEAS